MHRNFNEICKNENLLPKYTNFKLHDAAAREEDLVKNCRSQLIDRQIEDQELNISRLTKEILNIQ